MNQTEEKEYSQELRQIYHKHISENKYTKYNGATHVLDNVPVEAIANAMTEHTNAVLTSLLTRIEEETFTSIDSYDRGYNAGLKKAKTLLEEAINT